MINNKCFFFDRLQLCKIRNEINFYFHRIRKCFRRFAFNHYNNLCINMKQRKFVLASDKFMFTFYYPHWIFFYISKLQNF